MCDIVHNTAVKFSTVLQGHQKSKKIHPISIMCKILSKQLNDEDNHRNSKHYKILCVSLANTYMKQMR